MRNQFVRLLLLALLAGSIAAGQTSADSSNTTDLSSLSWMSGSWSGSERGVEMEEVWMAPKGNTMLGLHRDVKNGRTIMFEFLRIEANSGGITYWASPKGRAATPFRLIEHHNQRAVFENPQHDFPTRIIYWLAKDGALHARVEGKQGDKVVSEEWAWRRSN